MESSIMNFVEFLFGIEHETALIRPDGQFADYTNTTFEELQNIIDGLPLFEEDYPHIRKGNGTFEGKRIREKRWYAEGFERYSPQGSISSYLVKGIETRTPPRSSIPEAILELSFSLRLLYDELQRRNWKPTWVSYHPFRTHITSPELIAFEKNLYTQNPDMQTGLQTLLSYGPDINISSPDADEKWAVDLARKLTYYSPFIVPFTASSPFSAGKRWDGISYRTFMRTGPRMAALAFVTDPKEHPLSAPPITKKARTPEEVGRVEMKSFDTLRNSTDYAPVLALIKGLALDETLSGRSDTPDINLHQKAARKGFTEAIGEEAERVLGAAENALRNDPDKKFLKPLADMLRDQRYPAQELIASYEASNDILKTLESLTPHE